jgi:putative transcriptional regulator
MDKNKSQAQKKDLSPMRELREELGMTQLEFANALGITTTTVSRAEQGHREPVFTIAQFKKLCEISGKQASELPNYFGKPKLDK